MCWSYTTCRNCQINGTRCDLVWVDDHPTPSSRLSLIVGHGVYVSSHRIHQSADVLVGCCPQVYAFDARGYPIGESIDLGKVRGEILTQQAMNDIASLKRWQPPHATSSLGNLLGSHSPTCRRPPPRCLHTDPPSAIDAPTKSGADDRSRSGPEEGLSPVPLHTRVQGGLDSIVTYPAQRATCGCHQQQRNEGKLAARVGQVECTTRC